LTEHANKPTDSGRDRLATTPTEVQKGVGEMLFQFIRGHSEELDSGTWSMAGGNI
jgi:hypothetical protein